MTIPEFMNLTEVEKANTLWYQGTFMAGRVEKEITFQLYKMDDFFVEAIYDPTTETPSGFHPFTSTRLLLPYLDDLI
ncbi:MAG: hypothetical protein JWQ25_2765 [Daejeonella sp.]|nr:hypothetical protein [Daejeonella sp.]